MNPNNYDCFVEWANDIDLPKKDWNSYMEEYFKFIEENIYLLKIH